MRFSILLVQPNRNGNDLDENEMHTHMHTPMYSAKARKFSQTKDKKREKSMRHTHTQNSIVSNHKRMRLKEAREKKKQFSGLIRLICIDVHYLEIVNEKHTKIHLQAVRVHRHVFAAAAFSLLISFKVTFDNFPDCWAYNNISYIYFSVKLRIIPLICWISIANHAYVHKKKSQHNNKW